LGDFNNSFDPGFSLNIGAERTVRTDLSLVALIGFHQFYGPVQNQHLVQVSLNAKYVSFGIPERFVYINAGPGIYRPRSGSAAWGANVGAGTTWVITPRLGIDLNMDYHLVDYSEREMERATFADIQMGIVWSY
jgi:hypothetical protein